MKLTPGEIIEQKYRILRLLGTGGMGSVYEAENVRLDRRVAIKVMHKSGDQQDIARFEREARAAQIGSPNIVQVFDLGYLPDGAPYMVMEYLAGESLGERLQRVRSLTATELLPIARQILDGLGAAHRSGIIHRDLKPDNVYLARVDGSDHEVVKLLDFGISKFTEGARRASDVSLTRSGVAVGTPHFMSPEQVQGSKELDTRTDLYSLGVILYRCLSGQLPFQSDEVAPLLVQILLETPKMLHELRPDADLELSRILARAMARRADDRFQTAAEFRAALADWERNRVSVPPATPSLGVTPAQPRPTPAPHGTNASWSSTAAEVPERNHTLRNVALAALFSLAGFSGLFIAYKLWSGAAPETPEPAGAGSVVQDEVRTNDTAPSARTDDTGANGLVSSALPLQPPAPAVTPNPSPAQAEPASRSGPSAPTQAIADNRRASPSPRTAEPPTSAAVPATTSPVAVPVPATKPPVVSADEPDNRHMSRGVH